MDKVSSELIENTGSSFRVREGLIIIAKVGNLFFIIKPSKLLFGTVRAKSGDKRSKFDAEKQKTLRKWIWEYKLPGGRKPNNDYLCKYLSPSLRRVNSKPNISSLPS